MMLVSKAFYIDGLSKVQIAAEMGISRFRVARALAAARDVGIVSITLNSGAPMPELSERVRAHLRLRDAHVVEVYGDLDSLRTAVGRATGARLSEVLRDGESLGIGWGRTLDSMMDGVEHLPEVEVIQLSGRFEADRRNAAAELTRRAVALTGGAFHAIPAPFFVDDARVVNALRRHPEVAAVVAGFDQISTAVVSVGTVWPQPITIAFSSMPRRFTESLLDSGAVGEICGNLFSREGYTVESPLWRHLLTITPDQMRGIERVIGAAVHPVKAEAVRAVCQAAVINELVLDVELAHTLLRLPEVTSTLAD
ncbi:sugar-binding transcriptional regulator [Ruania albidiflava]|uniref:sugar-binding transcriptional regulator n=1 Tax=Ruania albidiflava TaxID=366586 RepID=UPI0003B3A0B9|nr:sugar-binding domain-containing protein [Ruania albidiflava]